MALALEMGVNPSEIENEWDVYWINRLLMFMEARAKSQEQR